MRRDSLLWPGIPAVLALLMAAITLSPDWREPPVGGDTTATLLPYETVFVVAILYLAVPLLGLGTLLVCGPQLWRRGGWARWIGLAAIGIAIGLPLYVGHTSRFEMPVGTVTPRSAPGTACAVTPQQRRPACERSTAT